MKHAETLRAIAREARASVTTDDAAEARTAALHDAEACIAGADAIERVAVLEAVLVAVRAAREPDAPEATRAFAAELLAEQLDPSRILDAMLHVAWLDGRDGRPHPLADSPCAESRAIAESAPPVIDTFLGGDPRRFEPMRNGLSSVFPWEDFNRWLSRCEEAEKGAAPLVRNPDHDARDLPPYASHAVHQHDGGDWWKDASSRPFCSFGIGKNHPQPGDWRAWAAPLRKEMRALELDYLRIDLASRQADLACWVPPDEAEDDGWPRTTPEEIRRWIASTESRITELEREGERETRETTEFA
jgi:hypothetical protein